MLLFRFYFSGLSNRIIRIDIRSLETGASLILLADSKPRDQYSIVFKRTTKALSSLIWAFIVPLSWKAPFRFAYFLWEGQSTHVQTKELQIMTNILLILCLFEVTEIF